MKCALFSVLAVSVMLACESDRPFAPKPPGLSALISDGGHSPGNPHFFFLPPLVKPVTPPPFSGVFNANLAPVVQICALGSNGACSSTSVIRQFTTLTGPFNPLQVFDFVQVVKQLQLYFVVWRPDWVKLNSGVTYRIMALVGSQALGFADIKVVRTEDEFAQVWNAGAFVPLLRGAPALPITFRIEQDALCSGGVDCTEVTVGAAAQDVITTSQRAAIHFDAGSFSQNVELVIKKVMTDGKTTCHTTDLQQFNDCYDIRITPNIPLNAGHFARVEICLALDPTDVDAGKKDPLLVKSEPGVPGVVELTEAGHTLITCPGYPTVGSPIGAQAPRNLWNVARASWHLSRCTRPRPPVW